MADLKSLSQKRGRLSARLTRFQTFIDSFSLSESIYELKSRLEKMEIVWNEFDQYQSDIEDIDQSEEQLNYRIKFENEYYQAVGKANEYLSKSQPGSSNNSNSNTQVNNLCNGDTNLNVKLPTLQLPEFDGSYSEYMQFFDSFNALVNKNITLSNTQKFYYLKSCLKGQALQVVQALEVTDGNYKIALSLLKDRYENKRIIVNIHLKHLFNLPVLCKESGPALRDFLNETLKHVQCLKGLGEETDKWNSILIYLISNKLDNITKREWESSLKSNDMPNLNNLTDFLTQRCHMLETIQDNKLNVSNKEGAKSKYYGKTYAHLSTNKYRCYYCNESHYIYNCNKFKSLSVQLRLNEIKKLKLCTNCFRSNHATQECISAGCKHCNKKHNTLLHFEGKSNNLSSDRMEDNIGNSSTETVLCSANSLNSDHNYNIVLLSTAIVEIYNDKNEPIRCRALLDSGSMSCFMSRRLSETLKLPSEHINLPISGINSTSASSRARIKTKIKSVHTSYSSYLSFFVLDNITGNVPQYTIPISEFIIPSNIALADPQFNKSLPIDLLLGAQIFHDLLCVGQIKINKHHPIFQKTKLGWIVSGPLNSQINSDVGSCLLTMSDLSKQVERFWEIENTEVNRKILTREESLCEQRFSETIKRDISGRFTVTLPIKNILELGSTENIAKKRLLALENKLDKNNGLKKQYVDFMMEYINLGHMTKIKPGELQTNETIYYMPHHGVLKQSSLTTKLRVVFNASQPSTSGKSLNDVLLTGPCIQDDLFSILIRFRKHNYVITADIEKMYRQINVDESQRDLQRILWRTDPKQEISHYRLNTITYGTSPASYLATRCLEQIAIENRNEHITACQALSSDCYMDDLLTGNETIEATRILKFELEQLLSRYGFKLRQWLSNNSDVLHDTQTNNKSEFYRVVDDGTVKTLGILWHSSSDTLQYACNREETAPKVSKRAILSVISKIFDPLGLIGPIIIRAKIILQHLWKLKIGWDESIPQELYTMWLEFERQLTSISSIQFPRQVVVPGYVNIQLHGFSDASLSAYGACVYIRSTNVRGEHHIRLLTAKSRVAPLKSITLPRLELCGALLLAKLVKKVREALKISFDKLTYWSDSQIVLSWLADEPSTWKTFVCNRVAEIHELSNANEWRYVRSMENPADIISRGCSPNNFKNLNLWFNGPTWLQIDEVNWPPKVEKVMIEEIAEKRTVVNTFVVSTGNELDILVRYSTFNKLIRVIAYIYRFINNVRSVQSKRKLDSLSISEMDNATKVVIKSVQSSEFASEISSLKRLGRVPRSSKLASLNPFLDSNDIMRVGGRLRNSDFNYTKKHPILLPKHHVTTLIIDREHKRLLHAGAQQVLASLRDTYWPINGRNVVRFQLRKCITCFKSSPREISPLMGDLPAPRVVGSRPFQTVGIDLAGPFNMKDGKTRNRKIIKVYVCLFICFNTKSVHLELIGDLTTDSFLNTLKRFIARRGICTNIYTDNATNFVGASAELKNVFRKLNSVKYDSSTREYLINNKISWKFIPPRAPHFAGLWERAIKSAKYYLKRILNVNNMDFEQFYTVLTQIESILNSRPICPLSNDPNDLEALTPGHFLIGTALTSLPQENVEDISFNRLKQYHRLQQMVQHFWKRWSKEYINNLQHRSKWRFPNVTNLQVNQMVLLKEDRMPCQTWRLGRITGVHPGSDGVVRVVDVRTSTGVVKRAFSKVCVLPIEAC